MTDDGDIVYFGCYTQAGGGRGAGIAAARRDPASGALTPLGTVADTPSPSFLARHPELPVLYAVNEVTEGTVGAWAVGPDGKLSPLGERSTGGDSPCHVAVTPDGGHLLVTNYGSGSVAVFPLDLAGVPGDRSDLVTHDGHGVDPDRQAGPHAHQVSPDPAQGPVLAVDLGTDRVYRYDLDPVAGRLRPSGQPVRTPAGTGPRHLARHPDGQRWYLVGELSATVLVYHLDGAGGARELGRVPASSRSGHVQPSEVAVGRDGRFLYVANRGVGTIAVFALDGELPRQVAEVPTGGHWPRHFAIIGNHLYVTEERADLVTRFAIDPETGVPVPAGAPLELPSPTCVLPTADR
ncbi:lactonase family protein [Solwaraspora sp. WMMD1047]|uniref:lactonase family protein n=1 Tax=Solwaraspora sp. WMMD1047 TaxID=3016102 RepID=UPI00241619BA|nr:lactonase family protein [Solwaraspora sp. WMMD1047]MDG4828881.1 lactonase family protein [Solwaraspora sp. WMMD1047]